MKKSLRPARRRELAACFHGTFQVSCLRACRLAQFSCAAWYRQSCAKDQSALRIRIRDLTHARPRFGYLMDLGVAASGRLAGESEAGAATQAHRAAPRTGSGAGGTDEALEHGFRA